MNPLFFPDARTLGDLFDVIAVVQRHTDDPIGDTRLTPPDYSDSDDPAEARRVFLDWTRNTTIGSHCGTTRLRRNTHYLRLRPNATVAAAISARVVTSNDSITFCLVERSGGTVLVLAQSSAILQSLWLAELPSTASIPADLWDGPDRDTGARSLATAPGRWGTGGDK